MMFTLKKLLPEHEAIPGSFRSMAKIDLSYYRRQFFRFEKNFFVTEYQFLFN